MIYYKNQLFEDYDFDSAIENKGKCLRKYCNMNSCIIRIIDIKNTTNSNCAYNNVYLKALYFKKYFTLMNMLDMINLLDKK